MHKKEPTQRFRFARYAAVLPLLALGILYAATLQTHISGSFPESTAASILKNEYIKDVSEIQVALNVWGTIHHTGYPLFAILGNLFTLPLRVVGIEPAAAASLYALAWGVVMLAAFGLLIARLTQRPLLASLSVLLLGLTRTFWLHNVLAEVYSMSMAITALLLALALWPAGDSPGRTNRLRRRFLWLALLGGIGVAHHRAVIFIAPGLIYATWPLIQRERRRLLLPALGLGLLGLLPYLYLPLRAWQDADWVYGEPDTLRGLWTEFSGEEASYLVTLPPDLAGWGDNLAGVWDILITELTLPGLLIGLAGLTLAMTISSQRHAARVAALVAAGPLLFAITFHTAVLPQAVLMPVVLVLVFGVALSIDWLLRQDRVRWLARGTLLALAVWAALLAAWHYNYIDELVHEPSGQQTIERLAQLPREDKTALMLPWGPRYAAASYARLVTEDYADVMMVDHKGEFGRLLAEGYQLYTEPETFYTYPPPWPTDFNAGSDWWQSRLGTLYISSAGPSYVQLQAGPWLAEPGEPVGTHIAHGIARRAAWLTCDDSAIYLHVIWGADSRPDADPSIFVHLQGDEPTPNPPNADQRHPVHGWYPFAQWSPGELVHDDYTLPRLPDRTQVIFGLYEQDATGQFVNFGELTLPVADCQPVTLD